MGLILKFANNVLRQNFVEKLAREHPELSRVCKASPVLPHLLIKDVTADQERWLKEAVQPFGRAFADIQYQTFAE